MLVLGKGYHVAKSAVVPRHGAQRRRAGRGQLEADRSCRASPASWPSCPAGSSCGIGGPSGPSAWPPSSSPWPPCWRSSCRPTTVATEPERRGRARGAAQRGHLPGRDGDGPSSGGSSASCRSCWRSRSRTHGAPPGTSASWPRRRSSASSSAPSSPHVCADSPRSASSSARSSSRRSAVCSPRSSAAARRASILSWSWAPPAAAAKQAFDSIVQRDAPDANRGRSFARFETRFQLFWVIGALIPIVVPFPAPVGFPMIGVASGVTVAWYLVGMRRIRQGRVPVRRRGWRRRPLYGPDAVDGRCRPGAAPASSASAPARVAGRSTASRAGSRAAGSTPRSPRATSVAPPSGADPTVVVPSLPESDRDPTVVDATTVADPPGRPRPGAPAPTRLGDGCRLPPDTGETPGQASLFGPEAWDDGIES